MSQLPPLKRCCVERETVAFVVTVQISIGVDCMPLALMCASLEPMCID